MVKPTAKPDMDWARQLIRSIRLNRTVGFLFTLAIMWPIIYDYSPIWAGVLALHSLLWPHFVYHRTFQAQAPLRDEVKYIFFDNGLLGFWLGLAGFPIALIALYLTTVTINTTIMGGLKLFSRGFGFMIIGCLFGGSMQGWHYFQPIPTYGVVLTILGLWLYGGMISNYSYTQAKGLIQVKRYLRQRNAELEALDEIVQILNRETDYNRLLTTLLEKGMLLFPNSERAFFLEFDALTHKAKTTVSIGFPDSFDAEGRPDLSLLENESFKIFGPTQSFFSIKQESTSAATVVLPVHLDKELAGIMVFENESDMSAFSGLEKDLLHRFQSHAITALSKARLMQDLRNTAQNLKDTQKQLLDSAHMAGMAEIAISILHNLGNALNSLNVSTSLIQERLGNQRMLPLLEQVVSLMEQNRDNLGQFLVETPQGKKILPALKELAKGLFEWREKLSHEFENLGNHLHHVMEVVRSQEDYINVRGFCEELEVKSLVEEALSIASPFLKKHQVDVAFHHPKDSCGLFSQRSKILQILVNLIKNACEAMHESPERNLSITIEHSPEEIGIILKDTGPGISAQLCHQIFQFGFTTKKDGHGYGLHYCALAATELGGDLNLVDSRSGAVFKLNLPKRPPHKKK